MSSSDNGSKKRRVNILDIILILLIVCAVAFATVTVIKANPNIVSGGDKAIKYVLNIDTMPVKVAEQIAVGDKIYDDVSNQLLGTVTDVQISDAYLVGYKPISNEPVYTKIDGKVKIAITVKVDVWADGSSFKIDNYRIAVGKEVNFHSRNVALTGLCTKITTVQ